MPYSLAGLSITVNNIPVPIQSVANDQFGQHANFQAPCELTGSSATVVVTVNGASTTVHWRYRVTGPARHLYHGRAQ